MKVAKVMGNPDIKFIIHKSGLKQWQVADVYGISEGNFCRLLRKPLSEYKRKRVLEAIEKAKKEYLGD